MSDEASQTEPANSVRLEGQALAGQSCPNSIDDILHCERREKHAEEPRQHDIAGHAEEPADPLGENEGDETRSGDQRCYCDKHQKLQQTAAGLAGKEDRRGDRARSGEQRHRQRKGCNVADALLDRLFRGFAFIAASDPEHHLGRNPKQQQAAGDAKAGSEISRTLSRRSPASAVPIRIAPAMMLARTATLSREPRGIPVVTTRKVGAMAIGSTTTKSVSRLEIAKSSNIFGPVLRRRGP